MNHTMSGTFLPKALVDRENVDAFKYGLMDLTSPPQWHCHISVYSPTRSSTYYLFRFRLRSDNMFPKNLASVVHVVQDYGMYIVISIVHVVQDYGLYIVISIVHVVQDYGMYIVISIVHVVQDYGMYIVISIVHVVQDYGLYIVISIVHVVQEYGMYIVISIS